MTASSITSIPGLSLVVLLLLATGCGSHNESAKSSHFEHDHETVEHWPDDLADAATKIRERLAQKNSDDSQQEEESDKTNDHDKNHPHDPGAEITDIVSWVPEIAADTDLSQQDWIPLADASDSLVTTLRASKQKLSAANRKQILSFCELIDQSVNLIPTHSSLDETSP